MRSAVIALILVVAVAVPSAATSPFDVTVGEGEAVLWHFFHSGFALRTTNHLLVFDYWSGQTKVQKPSDRLKAQQPHPGVEKGHLAASDMVGIDQNVIMFISHEHYDHFDPDVIEWKGDVKGVRYVVSPEVANEDDRYLGDGTTVYVAPPNSDSRVGQVRVRAFEASDSGVAFLIEIDGLKIFHAGDHASWNWQDYDDAEKAFADGLIKFIGDEPIDIAMVVCDPRLDGKGWGGTVAFATTFQPKLLVPMHAKGKYEANETMKGKLGEAGYKGRFWQLSGRGATITYPTGQ